MQAEPYKHLEGGVGERRRCPLYLLPGGEPSVRTFELKPGGGVHLPSSSADLRPRFLRIDSPLSSMRCALCTKRSRMLSAMLGSPICSCQCSMGSWLVRIVERR